MILGEFLWNNRLVRAGDNDDNCWWVRFMHRDKMIFHHDCDTREEAEEYFKEIAGRMMNDLYSFDEIHGE